MGLTVGHHNSRSSQLFCQPSPPVHLRLCLCVRLWVSVSLVHWWKSRSGWMTRSGRQSLCVCSEGIYTFVHACVLACVCECLRVCVHVCCHLCVHVCCHLCVHVSVLFFCIQNCPTVWNVSQHDHDCPLPGSLSGHQWRKDLILYFMYFIILFYYCILLCSFPMQCESCPLSPHTHIHTFASQLIH